MKDVKLGEPLSRTRRLAVGGRPRGGVSRAAHAIVHHIFFSGSRRSRIIRLDGAPARPHPFDLSLRWPAIDRVPLPGRRHAGGRAYGPTMMAAPTSGPLPQAHFRGGGGHVMRRGAPLALPLPASPRAREAPPAPPHPSVVLGGIFHGSGARGAPQLGPRPLGAAGGRDGHPPSSPCDPGESAAATAGRGREPPPTE